MSFITRNQKDDAVYWEPAGNDGTGGKTWDTPQEIKVRWEDKQELFINVEGKEEISAAKIFVNESSLDSGTILAKGGFLYEGLESDLDSNHADPVIIDGAFEIRSIKNIKNLKGDKSLTTVMVK